MRFKGEARPGSAASTAGQLRWRPPITARQLLAGALPSSVARQRQHHDVRSERGQPVPPDGLGHTVSPGPYWGEHPMARRNLPAIMLEHSPRLEFGESRVNIHEENDTTMKKKSSIFICLAVALVYFGLAENLQAVPPPPPSVPDGGSSGVMLVAAVSAIGFLKWKLKR
jgi:hypothetical protein